MESNSKKRARDDSELESGSPESKRVNSSSDSESSLDGSPGLGRVASDPELEHIPESILDILDEDPEMVNSRDPPANEDLDSVIRSFEEEILHQHLSYPPPAPVSVDLTSDSGESQPDLGYLLEATDDELGLPPTEAAPPAVTNETIDLTVTGSSDAIDLGNMIELEDGFPGYDSFGLGLNESSAAVHNNDNNANGGGDGDFVTVDGLFDYSEPSDFSGLSWQPESLPAL